MRYLAGAALVFVSIMLLKGRRADTNKVRAAAEDRIR